MINPDPLLRTKIGDVVDNLVAVKEAYSEVGKTNYKPDTLKLFDPELLTRT